MCTLVYLCECAVGLNLHPQTLKAFSSTSVKSYLLSGAGSLALTPTAVTFTLFSTLIIAFWVLVVKRKPIRTKQREGA